MSGSTSVFVFFFLAIVGVSQGEGELSGYCQGEVCKSIKAIYFDFYGTITDVSSLSELVREIVRTDEEANRFTAEWRSKQLEYTWLRGLMNQYVNFWGVTEEALSFTVQRYKLNVTEEQKNFLMGGWLHPVPFPEVPQVLTLLKQKFSLHILTNGAPKQVQIGLEKTNLKHFFDSVLSVDSLETYKPSAKVYDLMAQSGLAKDEILFVSANGFDVLGAKAAGYKTVWVNRRDLSFETFALPNAKENVKADLEVRNLEKLLAPLGIEPNLLVVAKPTLTYFNLKGRGEVPRLILEEAGADYDYRPIKAWAEVKKDLQPILPFAQVPLYQEPGGFSLVQSRVIAKYLAKKYGFEGSNPSDNLAIEVILEGVRDLEDRYSKARNFPEESKRPEQLEKFSNEVLPVWLSHLENILTKRGSSVFFVGRKLSLADFYVFNLLDVMSGPLPNLKLQNYPHLQAFFEGMKARPRIKAFYDRDPYKKQ